MEKEDDWKKGFRYERQGSDLNICYEYVYF